MSERFLEVSEDIAMAAHRGQFRRDGHTPYIVHLKRVVDRLSGESPEVLASAWLHDVLEDTEVSIDYLELRGVPDSVVEAVRILTRTDREYASYIARVKSNPIALKVKIADMEDNLSDAPTPEQADRYTKALDFLRDEKRDAVSMTWDEYFMRMAYLAASKSKDPRTKIGAVLVRRDGCNDPISTGYNGFARGLDDSPGQYLDRTLKHRKVCHAEFNAVVNAARKGISTLGAALYTQAPPCSDCAKALIQAGVAEVVCHRAFDGLMDKSKWADSQELAAEMMSEAGVRVRWLEGNLGLGALVDGGIHEV